MDKVIVGGSLIPSTVDTPLDKRERVATFAEIANIENPAKFMTIVVEDTGRHYEVRKLSSKVIGGLVVENAGIDINDPEALYDLTAVEEARVEAERKREEEEDTRKRNEAIRQENESKRGLNEAARKAAEIERADSEISREEHEQIRMINESERKENEISRQSKELSREQYEASRKSSETERRNSENKRIENENTRKSNESQRESNENQRKSNETERQSKENTRISAEDRRLASEATREANELNRKNNEATRVQNETQRVSNENARVKSENERKAEYAGLKTELEEQIENAKNFDSRKADIDGQYDKLTSGNAQNLIGRGVATSEEFNFRPSGEISIQDGTARVKKLKGNSVVYNQLVKHGGILSRFGITTTFNESTNIYTINGTATASGQIYGTSDSGGMYAILKSKYFYKRLTFVGGTVTSSTNVLSYGDIRFPNNGSFSIYCLNRDNTNFEYLLVQFKTGDIFDNYQIRVECFDLLKMFGSVEAIPPTEEDFLKLFPDSYYPYNPGEIKSLTATGIKSVGFNAWDGKYKVGYIDDYGEYREGGSKAVSDYFQLIKGETYYLYSPLSISLYLYDKDKKYIRKIEVIKSNTTFVAPIDCEYIRFRTYGILEGNICINLSNTGYRDGEYQPYVDFTRELPIYKIKDSEGNLLFPDGLCSAGSVYDKITEKKAIKRIGKVDLGTLDWNYATGVRLSNVFIAKQAGVKRHYTEVMPNAICVKYTPISVVETSKVDYAFDDVIDVNSVYQSENSIVIRDTSFTDAASLKESLQGVYLYYELATPIEVDLDPEVNMDYEVWDFGTEQMISEGFSTPIRADIVYGFNAVDRIRENTLNIEDLIKRIVQLETKITNIETTQANENTQVD